MGIEKPIWDFREKAVRWKLPEPKDCILYAITELGEAVDAYLRQKRQGDLRRTEKDKNFEEEVADIAIMVISAYPNKEFHPDPYEGVHPEDAFATIGYYLSLLLMAPQNDHAANVIVDYCASLVPNISDAIRKKIEKIRQRESEMPSANNKQ